MLSRQSVLTTAGLILLVGLTNYLSLKKSNSQLTKASHTLYITGIGNNINIIQTTPAGSLDYTAHAEKIIKYSDGKSRLFHIQATDFKNNPPWHLTAFNGWAYPNNSQIDLWDQVHIFRNAGFKNKPLDFKTSQLTYYPPTDLATTDQLVQISEPKTHNLTTAIGLRAHPKAQTFQLLSQVHSTYEPPISHTLSTSSDS